MDILGTACQQLESVPWGDDIFKDSLDEIKVVFKVNPDGTVSIEDSSKGLLDKIPLTVTNSFKTHLEQAAGDINSKKGEPIDNNSIIQDIEESLLVKLSKLQVKKLRNLIPKLMMVCYLTTDEWQQKEKVKNLWDKRPSDFPDDVPFIDPNNGKRGTNSPANKPKRDDLEKMYSYLIKVYKNKHHLCTSPTAAVSPHSVPVTVSVPTVAVDDNNVNDLNDYNMESGYYQQQQTIPVQTYNDAISDAIQTHINQISTAPGLPLTIETQDKQLMEVFNHIKIMMADDDITNALIKFYNYLDSHVRGAETYDELIKNCFELCGVKSEDEVQQRLLALAEPSEQEMAQEFLSNGNSFDLHTIAQAVPTVAELPSAGVPTVIGDNVYIPNDLDSEITDLAVAMETEIATQETPNLSQL